MIRVISNPNGLRLYTFGRRVHHGSAGLLLAIAGGISHHQALTALGCAMVLHDARDCPWRDCDNH